MYKWIAVLFSFILFSSCASAADYLPGTTMLTLEKYEVTIQKVEFSPDATGDNWVTAAEGDQITTPTMDIASKNFSERVARFAQDLSLPVGTYVRCKLTIGSTFVIKGTVSYGGSTYKTKTTPPSLTTGDVEESTVTNTDDQGNPQSYTQTVSGNLTITEEQTATMKVTMSTNDCLGMRHYYGPTDYLIIPREPSWTFTQE